MRTIVRRREDVHRGPLILVNSAHPLPEDAQFALAPVDDDCPRILMERGAARLLAGCIHAVRGRREIVPVSGWRSMAEQQKIWDDSMTENGEAFTRKYVALPGCSEHQTGLAIDLGRASGHIDFIRPAFPYDGVCGAFRRQAERYGFIERYEKGKEKLTGIAHEPWHFRYVGTPHAQLIRVHGLCLEEYSEFLQSGPRSCDLDGSGAAQVFYVPCMGEETEIQVPEGCVQVSGDNISGFIVTCWGRIA